MVTMNPNYADDPEVTFFFFLKDIHRYTQG